MNRKKLMILIFPSVLTGCGFGGNNANPLSGQENADGYLTPEEKQGEYQQWQARFDEKTAEYNQSIAAYKQQNESDRAALKTREAELQKKFDEAKAREATSHRQTVAKLNEDHRNYVAQSNKTIANFQKTITMYEQQIDSYQEQINDPNKPSFSGLLHQFEVTNATAQSFTWETNKANAQGRALNINFKMHVGHEFVQSLSFEPALPPGLEVKRVDDYNWEVSGTPRVQVQAGKAEERRPMTIRPVFSNITDETVANYVAEQTFEKKIILVFTQTKEKPVIEQITSKNGLITVSVTDPSIIEGGEAPMVSIETNEECNVNSQNVCVDASPYVTTVAGENNPVQDGDVYRYQFQVRGNLVPDSVRNSVGKLTLSVAAQSRVSGLSSVPRDQEVQIPSKEGL